MSIIGGIIEISIVYDGHETVLLNYLLQADMYHSVKTTMLVRISEDVLQHHEVTLLDRHGVLVLK